MKYQQFGKFIVAVFVSFGLLACSSSEPTLDASSEDAYEKSVALIMQSLPEDQRQLLPMALISLTISEADENAGPLAGLVLLSQASPAVLVAKLGNTYDGKTGAEIFEFAEAKNIERLGRRIEAVDTKIAEIRAEQTAEASQLASVKAVLDRIKITSPTYHWEEQGGLILMPGPVVSFNIVNNGEFPIKTFHALAFLRSPGRSVPWVEDVLRYQISGGIEPGETHGFSDRQFLSGWSNPELKSMDDLVLEVTLIGIKDASDQLFSVERRTSNNLLDQIERLENQRAELMADLETPTFIFQSSN